MIRDSGTVLEAGMYVVPLAWIAHVAQVRGHASPDVLGGLRAAGLPLRTLDSTGTHVSARQFAAFIEEAARIAGDDFYGLDLGRRYDVRASGLVAYVSLACATARESLRNACRFGTISDTSADYALSEREGEAFFRVETRSPQMRMSRQATEFKVALVVEACRAWVGPAMRPREAHLAVTRASGLREAERRLGCTARYGMEATGLVFASSQLELAPRTSDPFLLDLLERVAAEHFSKRPPVPDVFRIRVERLLLDELPKGTPTAGQIANALGISERTMARRLVAEGAPFGQVLDELRRDMALRYLEDPGISLSQVAFLLGYGDQSAFSNAFRRWTGRSPSQFRSESIPAAK